MELPTLAEINDAVAKRLEENHPGKVTWVMSLVGPMPVLMPSTTHAERIVADTLTADQIAVKPVCEPLGS